MTRAASSVLVALGILLSAAPAAAAAVPLTLDLVPSDSHITVNALFSGLPSAAQEGTAGITDLVPGSPSNRTTFQGTITIAVDNVQAPSTIQILSSSADADVSGSWHPQVRPYQDVDADLVPGEIGLPAEGGDSEVATNTNFSPAAPADWGTRIRHPAFGVDIAYCAYRDISYNIISASEAVTLGQFSSLSQHFEPDGFMDYWIAPAAGGRLGRTDASTGHADFYDNTAALSSYTATPLGGDAFEVTLFIPVLVDDMGDTIRTTYTGQFLARGTVVVPEPAGSVLLTVMGLGVAGVRRRR